MEQRYGLIEDWKLKIENLIAWTGRVLRLTLALYCIFSPSWRSYTRSYWKTEIRYVHLRGYSYSCWHPASGYSFTSISAWITGRSRCSPWKAWATSSGCNTWARTRNNVSRKPNCWKKKTWKRWNRWWHYSWTTAKPFFPEITRSRFWITGRLLSVRSSRPSPKPKNTFTSNTISLIKENSERNWKNYLSPKPRKAWKFVWSMMTWGRGNYPNVTSKRCRPPGFRYTPSFPYVFPCSRTRWTTGTTGKSSSWTGTPGSLAG